jgi:hypothetical protein
MERSYTSLSHEYMDMGSLAREAIKSQAGASYRGKIGERPGPCLGLGFLHPTLLGLARPKGCQV